MPLVTINVMQGRPVEKIERMIVAVSHAIADTLDAPIGTVRIIVNEMQPHQYGIGGKPWPLIVADREAGANMVAPQPTPEQPTPTEEIQ